MPRAKNAAKKMGSKAKGGKGSTASKSGKKTAPADAGQKRKFRFKAGTVALREIKRYQKRTEMLLPRAPFQRLVRNITGGIDNEFRFQAQALLAM